MNSVGFLYSNRKAMKRHYRKWRKKTEIEQAIASLPAKKWWNTSSRNPELINKCLSRYRLSVSSLGSVKSDRYLRNSGNKACKWEDVPDVLVLPLSLRKIHPNSNQMNRSNCIKSKLLKMVEFTRNLFVPTYRIISCITVNTRAIVLAAL